MLKADWEKTQEYTSIDEQTIKAMVENALPDKTLLSHKIIAGGCANLNIKLNLKGRDKQLILRIYLRDKEVALKEQKIAALLKGNITVPEILCVGSYQNYRYALVEYIEGQTLRDIILDEGAQNADGAVYEAGQFVATLQQYKFPHSGFFDTDLKVKESLATDSFKDYLYESLKNSIVRKQLGKNIIERIAYVVQKYEVCFPNGSERDLVHADYDPSNMLVTQSAGKWKIAAILDWEFAFSGPYLCDVANMLRYAHKLPKSYEKSFLKGMRDAGIKLPDNWQVTIKLLNLLSLLDCLVHSSPQRPRQGADIKDLIEYITTQLEKI